MKVSDKGRYVRLELDVWYQDDDQSIHIASNDRDLRNFHTTVNNKVGSKRCHENLFKKFTEALRKADKPAPTTNYP